MNSSKRFSRSILMGFLALAIMFSHASGSWAKDQTVKFASGTTSATLKGAVIRGESDGYLVTAKAGQTMVVKIESLESNAVFAIFLPGKSEETVAGAGEGEDATSWQGSLPKSGTYRISVGPTRGNAEYTLRVEIK